MLHGLAVGTRMHFLVLSSKAVAFRAAAKTEKYPPSPLSA
jgi:hypothetical protein